jgi:hypothetical protein
VLGLSILMVPALNGSAAAIAGNISISGVVPPMRFIIVNNCQQITEIISNTKTNVIPQVWRDAIGNKKPLPLSAQLARSYYQKIRMRNIGVIKFNLSKTGQAVHQPSWVSYISWLKPATKLF